jgi:hypothetical protein
MTARRPLVIDSGLQQELPAGDYLADPVLAAIAQLSGYTSANIAEVEAGTKALRVTFRENDGPGSSFDRAFTISRHALGMTVPVSATTAAISAQPIVTAGLVHPAIVILKKVTLGCVTTALTGTRAGLLRMQLKEYLPIFTLDSFQQWILPPLGTSSTVDSMTTGNLFSSLKGSQPQPMLNLSSLPGGVSIGGINITSKTLGDAVGDASVTVGKQNIPPTTIFDHMQHSPFVIGPNNGFLVTLDSPAAGTSQTIRSFINMVWDELQPIPSLAEV